MSTNASPYKSSSRLRDMVEANSQLLMVICRFGLPLGFGNSSVEEICRANDVDAHTFLAVANFVCGMPEKNPVVSVTAMMQYLRNAHDHILKFSFPAIRKKLIESINCLDTQDVAFLILKYFDDYVEEVRLHMEYENDIIFPYCRLLLKKASDPKFRISMYTDHHGNMVEKLNELKDIIINHYSQRDNALLISALYDVMSCEADLMSHWNVEENLFIPEIKRLELDIADQSGLDADDPEEQSETEEEMMAPLSEREKEIIRYVALGLTNKEIADKLFLSFHTVTTHRRNIASKLQIHSPAGLAIYAIIHKLIDLKDISISDAGF